MTKGHNWRTETMSCSHVVADEVLRGNFEDTGPDRDWGDRNEALLALQRLFDEAAKLEETDDGPAFDAEAWRALRLPLQQVLRDPRSHLVREACGLLVKVAQACNDERGLPKPWVSRDGGRPCLRDATPALFELLGSGNKLNARQADDCLVSVIDSTRSKHLVGAVFEYASLKRAGRAPHVRECCAAYAVQILQIWDAHALNKLGDDGAQQLCGAVAELLEDPAAGARSAARDAHAALSEIWPARAADIARDVDPKVARLLARGAVVAEAPAPAPVRRRQRSPPPRPPPAEAPARPPPPEIAEAPAPPPPPSHAEGARVRVLKNRTGTVRFVGATAFSSGAWVGVELDAPDGKHDGVVDGQRYFTCGVNRGVFVRASQAKTLDEDIAASSELPRAALLCHAHKHLLRDLMRELQAQLSAVGAYEKRAPSVEASAAYRVAAEQAAPPLIGLLAAYELRVAELSEATRSPPRSPGPGTSAAGPPAGGAD